MGKEKIDTFSKRIHELDLFRGFLIILVMVDHLLWFINFYIFKSNEPFLSWFWTSDLRKVLRELVLYSFMFACGISCYLSKNNKKRGLILLGLAFAITVVTHLIQLLPIFSDRVVIIDINIIGVIAIGILLYSLVEKSSNSNILLVIAILIMFNFFIIVKSRISPTNEYNPFLSILNSDINPIKEKFVGDYMPIFPYIIFLFLGGLVAKNLLPKKKEFFKRGDWERPICFMGRHTLVFYVLHEVIFTLLFMGIGAIIK